MGDVHCFTAIVGRNEIAVTMEDGHDFDMTISLRPLKMFSIPPTTIKEGVYDVIVTLAKIHNFTVTGEDVHNLSVTAEDILDFAVVT